MIDQFGNKGIFACVSDSYDIYNAVENLWGGTLKEKVENMNAMLVVRPDSGDPIQVPIDCVIDLESKFGSTSNKKGYKVLNNVRVIQGDGINKDDIENILNKLTRLGFSAENMAFGMGGGLLQKDFNRDTNKFAFKCSWAEIDGREVDIFKDPVTDKGKISKKGKLSLVPEGDSFKTVKGNVPEDILEVVYDTGAIFNESTLSQVRERAAI